MKLSDQALGSIMMALQKSLLEQSDIVPTLKGFTFVVGDDEELTVSNPPSFKVDDAALTEEERTTTYECEVEVD